MAYFVLAARRYSMHNESTGEKIAGTTIFYTDEPQKNDGLNGMLPMKVNGTFEDYNKFPTLPGFYDLDFKMKPGPDGKPRLDFRDATLKEPVVFEPGQF